MIPDLSALQDGKLHLIAFCGDKFVYLTEDPNGSQWALQDCLTSKFPKLVQRMLSENELKLTDGP
jgi:hypothetical protein